MPYSHKGSKTFFPLEIIADDLAKKTNILIFKHFINKSKQENLKFLGWKDKFNYIYPNLRIDNSSNLKYKNILLIDDVYNSGAHIFATCMKLWEIPVANIFVLTLGISDNVHNNLDNKFDWKWLNFYDDKKKTNDIINGTGIITLNFDKKELLSKKSSFEVVRILEKKGLNDLVIINAIMKKRFNVHVRKTAHKDKYLFFIDKNDKEELKKCLA